MRGRLALALALTSVGVCLNGVSVAGCVGPSVTVVPSTTRSSAVITVEGNAVPPGPCDDTGGGGSCSRQDRGGYDPDAPRPTLARGATLQLSLAGRDYPLGEFEPNPNARRQRTVRLPAGLPAGVGELKVLAADGSVISTTPLTIRP